MNRRPHAHSTAHQRLTVEHRLYALEYGTGVVKVGQSKAIRTRLNGYASRARRENQPVVRAWVSRGHCNAYSTEVQLIKFCAKQWENLPGTREYFIDADLDLILAFADGLRFDFVPDSAMTADHLAEMRALDAYLAGLRFSEFKIRMCWWKRLPGADGSLADGGGGR